MTKRGGIVFMANSSSSLYKKSVKLYNKIQDTIKPSTLHNTLSDISSSVTNYVAEKKDEIMQKPQKTEELLEKTDAVKQKEAVNMSAKKLDYLIRTSQIPLYRIKAVFPFDFFPNEIIIEVNKVHIIEKEFFASEKRNCFLIKDIADVYVSTSPLFATLHIQDRYFAENITDIRYLKKHEARRARRIIQGLITADKEGIDLTHIEDSNLLEKIETLGEVRDPRRK